MRRSKNPQDLSVGSVNEYNSTQQDRTEVPMYKSQPHEAKQIAQAVRTAAAARGDRVPHDSSYEIAMAICGYDGVESFADAMWAASEPYTINNGQSGQFCVW